MAAGRNGWPLAVKILCLYPVGALVALLAAALGFFASQPIPEGTAFATIIPLANGVLPATIFGDKDGVLPPAWEPLVPAVPADATPAARPVAEIFRGLPSGAQMPANGLGLCCRASAYDTESVRRSVLWYLLKGGRLLDTAQLYLNHRAVGLGIKDAIARGIPRSEMFITTKLTPRFYSGDSPTSAVAEWLEELGVGYLDLVLLHHPQGIPGVGTCASGTPKECRANAWAKLGALQQSGVIKDLGVSNFNLRQIDELAAAGGAPVAVNQVQYNAFAPEYQRESRSTLPGLPSNCVAAASGHPCLPHPTHGAFPWRF